MALPMNIHELLNGLTVEWERLEFKKGWNPLKVLHSICAFSNDINNWGGGYIILGIDETDGRPLLPPAGLNADKIDQIQKELLGLCNQLYPPAFPIVEPVIFQQKHVLIIWVPGGTNRPYKAPVNLLGKMNGSKEHAYYIRRFSSTVKAKHEDEKELISLAGSIPFDDRINHKAELTDLNITLMKAHLAEIDSDLLLEADSLPFADFCRRMNIVDGPDEFLKPKNVGLLFFNDKPHEFFRQAQIDTVEFKDKVGDSFTESIFKGTLKQQVISALNHIENSILQETIQKVPEKAEAIRFFNYPFQAVEEALVNAVYHKSYEIPEPVEVRIETDRIEILSFPGPVPPLNKNTLMDENVTSRSYRNRRIGDFFKELHLTEGRNTGFRKIRNAMKSNGSPAPIFRTDDDRSYFLTILPIHPDAILPDDLEGPVKGPVKGPVELEKIHIKILSECAHEPCSTSELSEKLGYAKSTGYLKRAIKKLHDSSLIAYTVPDKPKSRLQKYRTTELGLLVFEDYKEELLK
ncbi:MAG: putative DNA binding domain-containing protein [Euryarchaeota archaeon]|nr:putative DNA binding domain-containing protein [Euryarchaeota archaeon]